LLKVPIEKNYKEKIFYINMGQVKNKGLYTKPHKIRAPREEKC